MSNKLALVLSAHLLLGCATRTQDVGPVVRPDLQGAQAVAVGETEFGKALAALAEHDRRGDWTPERCRRTAERFLVAAHLLEKRSDHRYAHFNAALAYQRCGMTQEAKSLLTALVRDAPGFHRASAQLAVLAYAESGDIDGAISALEEAVTASEFKNVDALVYLATLLMKRDSRAEDDNGHDDRERARLELQRALAVDDGHMPARNQLAIVYLVEAGGSGAALELASASVRADEQSHATLELAALICSQAMRKNDRYAPIHNTAGLVHVRLGDLSAAAKAFARARELDPRFFEAHMNYAAVNLSFRGFKNAEEAYEKALSIRPDSYDALLGLSLALRGQFGDAGEDALFAKAEKLLSRAKALDPARPEAWFNEAILLQEFRARGLAPTESKQVLARARARFGEFLARAEGNPALADARTRAKERMQDIDQMLAFMQ